MRRFEAALAAAPIVVAEVDTELRYSWVHNPHPDLDPDAVIGKRDDEIDSGPEIDELVRLKEQVLATGEGLRGEIAFDRTDGRRWYDMSIEPRRSDDGEFLGLTTAALDITERGNAEYYGRFIDLWENADPALQPRVDAARRALQRLASEGRG